MKQTGAIEIQKLILPLGVVVGGYLILKHFGIIGENDSSSNSSAISQANESGVNNQISQEKSRGGFQTLSDSQAAGIANSIYNEGSHGGDPTTIVRLVIQANTTLDWLAIEKAFGTRKANAGSWLSTCGLLGLNCDAFGLDAFLNALLDVTDRGTINSYFSDQGINYSI